MRKVCITLRPGARQLNVVHELNRVYFVVCVCVGCVCCLLRFPNRKAALGKSRTHIDSYKTYTHLQTGGLI